MSDCIAVGAQPTTLVALPRGRLAAVVEYALAIADAVAIADRGRVMWRRAWRRRMCAGLVWTASRRRPVEGVLLVRPRLGRIAHLAAIVRTQIFKRACVARPRAAHLVPSAFAWCAELEIYADAGDVD